MYAIYAPIQAAYKESQSLKGFAKMRYDKGHKDSLSKYSELKERMQNLLQNGEKITPKQWKAEIQSLQSECNSIGKEQTKNATELVYAEVISYNKKNLERELQNESRQQNRQQSKIHKRREEEIVAKYTIKDSVFLTCLGLKNICCNYTSHSTRRIKQLQRMNWQTLRLRIFWQTGFIMTWAFFLGKNLWFCWKRSHYGRWTLL